MHVVFFVKPKTNPELTMFERESKCPKSLKLKMHRWTKTSLKMWQLSKNRPISAELRDPKLFLFVKSYSYSIFGFWVCVASWFDFEETFFFLHPPPKQKNWLSWILKGILNFFDLKKCGKTVFTNTTWIFVVWLFLQWNGFLLLTYQFSKGRSNDRLLRELKHVF